MTTSTPTESAPERQALLDAALGILRARGAQGLKVDEVLSLAGLGTRAFYRHFTSKDQLVVEVFADAAHAEALRLRQRMQQHVDPLGAVVAWIDGRLDLAFDDEVQSDLQYVSQQAQAVNLVDPETMAGVHAAMLAPLVEQIERGGADGTFRDVDPVTDARSIDAVTWACIERQWAAGDTVREDVRARVLAFCLRGLGATDWTSSSSRRGESGA